MNLFPRNPGPSHCPIFSLRCWAHRVLDAARAGAQIEDALIEQALRLTGDL